ncbi:MAG: DUF2848 domain-containing protein [Candidatus Competibacterales bacterium]
MFTLHADDRTLPAVVETLIIAGWTGRDAAAVQHHIDELEALGVTPPSQVPLYYRAPGALVTTGDHIQVVGDHTSGEVEPVIFAFGEELFVGLGSDHTDRRAEATSVALAKALCPKPVAPQLWPWASVHPHWDQLILKAWITVDGRQTLYQQGTLAGLRRPEELWRDWSHGRGLPSGAALFCGTLPAIDGVRPAEAFAMELTDPVRRATLRHHYRIEPLPLVS